MLRGSSFYRSRKSNDFKKKLRLVKYKSIIKVFEYIWLPSLAIGNHYFTQCLLSKSNWLNSNMRYSLMAFDISLPRTQNYTFQSLSSSILEQNCIVLVIVNAFMLVDSCCVGIIVCVAKIYWFPSVTSMSTLNNLHGWYLIFHFSYEWGILVNFFSCYWLWSG